MSKKRRNRHHGSSIDDLLKEEGVLDEMQAVAVKEVIAWQLQRAMKEKKLSKNRMAELMKTSRAQLDRLLDPEHGNVTIETLQRAANALGRTLHIEIS
jgi:antitoxin HicB